ncbi:hypothetical protein [Salinarimonas sp.]|uniref:hypothetical protein n=1 Tax=Salinarimonas sp. TaxID=2766526 RepID=UPI0032D95933
MDSGSTLVIGVFRTEEAASAADAALAREGFTERRVIRSDGESDAARAAAAEGYLPGSMVRVYGELLAEGATLAVVRAPFGEGGAAEVTMRSAEGYEAPPASPPPRNPAPFSTAFGIPVLTRSRSHTELMSKWSFSDFLGLPILSGKAAPLSSTVGAPVLVSDERERAKTTSFGMPILSNKPAPLSSAVGMPVLVSEKRPWTSSFGMPILSSNPTPLSSFLGLPVLTRKQR